MTTAADRITLDDRYLKEQGIVYLSGPQALVRLPVDQHRQDQRIGLRTATFISGYPGSPLASYDLALQQAGSLLQQHEIFHVPGANEELAATAISGTQMLDNYPHSRVDGVISLWYGKGPGIDRSGDALKHGNFAGTSKYGAVVILSGEDHEAKSSTMPFQDDYAFVSAGIPIIYPSSTGDFLSLGLHAIAMSRYSGCWVAMKLVNSLADGGETVEVHPENPRIVIPQLTINGKPFQKSTDFKFFPGLTIETERRLYYERHRAAVAYAQANGLDRVIYRGSNDRVGIITAGKSFADLREALVDLDFDVHALDRCGVRVLCLGLIYPVDAAKIREFARGLEEVIVIEEKRGFIESQIKEALCGMPQPIRVVGKFDEEGNPLFPIQGGMDSDIVAELLGSRLLRFAPNHEGVLRYLSDLNLIRSRDYESLPGRTPNYCSGCPHNISTRLLDGQIAWGSPGCHSFASIIEQPERHIVSMTQLGGEGLPWVGLAPFTDKKHIVQNVGDGSLFHSSYLNIRFCAAAGVNITFKILYNGFVANTGAQSMVGGKPIPELTRMLELEGVKRIALLTQHPENYSSAQLASIARVFSVDEQDRILEELEQEPGVTVLIYDGLCANERRRRQKRGKLPAPNKFVIINPDVCENCGHCGVLTNCMSLHKTETEFGPKTQIHISSCNQDYSCLGGDCPSFVTVETEAGTGYRKPKPPELKGDEVPEAQVTASLKTPYHIYIPGVGGTGILTLNALLCYAALIDGKFAVSYDQTGAAQKWGPVLSSLVISRDRNALRTNKVGLGKADLYLACDVMAASTPSNLDRCDSAKTAAVVNSTLLPTGEMIRQVHLIYPTEHMLHAIARCTDSGRNVYVEARAIVEALFGDYMATNIFTLGVAYQAGLVPLSARSIEAAIEINRVQVEQNLQAFRYGRLYQADRSRVQALFASPSSTVERERQKTLSQIRGARAQAYESLLARCNHLGEESRRLLAVRIGELFEYQNAEYAKSFVDSVIAITGAKDSCLASQPEITHAIIRNLYKLMAYKDEYEVARLHLRPSFLSSAEKTFAAPQKLVYNLHPPLLRQFGLKRKLAFGPWFSPVLRLLRSMRILRGTPLDIFGYAKVRQEERRLAGWYKSLMQEAIQGLDDTSSAIVLQIAQLPDLIRGYEEIKLTNIATAKAEATRLMASVTSVAKEASKQKDRAVNFAD